MAQTGDPRAPATRLRVCLAASPGGHMALLRAVAGAFEGCERTWVTGGSSQADALHSSGEDVRLLEAWARDAPGLQTARANLRGAWRVVRDARPELVVTSGAGLVVPFALLARARGARLALVETTARVTGASLSGRILAPPASAVLVQWPELAQAYRGAVVCRPALLEACARSGTGAGERAGTFVSVGTRSEPFGRLLEAVDRAVVGGVLPRPVTAQTGSTPSTAEAFEASAWLSPEEVDRALARSRYVVCHAGSAIVSAAVAAGHRPLVMPRSRARGEHRTEHQRQTLDKLAAAGLVIPLGDEISAAEVSAAEAPGSPPAGGTLPSVEEVLRAEVESLSRRG